jgi:hypothetical protein
VRATANCLSVLERQRHETEGRGSRAPAWRSWLEPAVAVGLCALYLAEAVTHALAAFR